LGKGLLLLLLLRWALTRKALLLTLRQKRCHAELMRAKGSRISTKSHRKLMTALLMMTTGCERITTCHEQLLVEQVLLHGGCVTIR
jgi:hypothetical protein